MTPADLEKLMQLCVNYNVTRLKTGDVEISLQPQPPAPTQSPEADGKSTWEPPTTHEQLREMLPPRRGS